MKKIALITLSVLLLASCGDKIQEVPKNLDVNLEEINSAIESAEKQAKEAAEELTGAAKEAQKVIEDATQIIENPTEFIENKTSEEAKNTVTEEEQSKETDIIDAELDEALNEIFNEL